MYGWAALPGFLNQTQGRREVKRLTGNIWVPVMVEDDGTVVQGSDKIKAWASANPGAGREPAGGCGRGELEPMSSDAQRDRREAAVEPDAERVRPSVTVEDLVRWEEHGATWRAVEVTDDSAVVELCTCYGEPVDMVRGDAPELVAFVRAHRAD